MSEIKIILYIVKAGFHDRAASARTQPGARQRVGRQAECLLRLPQRVTLLESLRARRVNIVGSFFFPVRQNCRHLGSSGRMTPVIHTGVDSINWKTLMGLVFEDPMRRRV